MVQNGAFPCFGKLGYKRSLPVVSNHQLCEYSSTAYTLQINNWKRCIKILQWPTIHLLESILFFIIFFVVCLKKKIAFIKKIRLQNTSTKKKPGWVNTRHLKTTQVRAPHRAPPVLPPWLFANHRGNVEFKNAQVLLLGSFLDLIFCWELLFFFHKVRAKKMFNCVRTRATQAFFCLRDPVWLVMR